MSQDTAEQCSRETGAAVSQEQSCLKAGPAEDLLNAGSAPARGHDSSMYRRLAEQVRKQGQQLIATADYLDATAAAMDKLGAEK